ncbi:MAG: divalent-cation tolerance protein CutA [Candidatus Thorarchaeota archaeon]
MSEYIIALTTCPPDIANKLARTLVESAICACVNIIPAVSSVYHWKDKIVEDKESILLIKTTSGQQERLWEVIKKEHPYDVPEYIVLPIKWGSQDYLDWISKNIKSQ